MPADAYEIALDLEPDAELPGVGPVAELVEKTGREGVNPREDKELEAN